MEDGRRHDGMKIVISCHDACDSDFAIWLVYMSHKCFESKNGECLLIHVYVIGFVKPYYGLSSPLCSRQNGPFFISSAAFILYC